MSCWKEKSATSGNGFSIKYIYPEIEGTPPTMQGWECPRCKRIYSPWVGNCLRCNNKVEEQEVLIQIESEGNDG